jgi:hypothetical protein
VDAYTCFREIFFNYSHNLFLIFIKPGNFVWQDLKAGFYVYRHELGHNIGHPHHSINNYNWRLRGVPFSSDGHDMMSGGNGYKISDIAAASKWFYNWIPDESVVLMQPEGPTSHCPQCVSSVQDLVLYSFDDRNITPSASIKTAVHIPVSSVQSTMYSYWLSYRGASDNKNAASGLGVHFSWFNLGGLFGASYDSNNYDIYGSTDTSNDAFVTVGTCFIVSPSPLGMHVDAAAVTDVQPIVCVKSISNITKSITINVSFLDKNSPPPSVVPLQSDQQISCSLNGVNGGNISLAMSAGKPHLLRYPATGSEGKVTLSLCRSSESSPNATVYFYDKYVHASNFLVLI